MRRVWWWRAVTVAAVVLIQWELLRTLYPPGYALVGDLGFVVTPVVLVGVFLAPVLAWPLGRCSPLTQWWLGIALVAGARLLIELVQPVLWVAAVAAVACLVGATLVLALGLADVSSRAAFAVGVTAAVAIDVVLKAGFAGWDRVWAPGWQPLAVTVLVVGALVVGGRVAPPPADATREAARSGTVLAGLGTLAMPVMTMFASVAFVGAGTGWELAAVTLLLAGTAAAAVAVAVALVASARRWLAVAAGVVGAGCAWWLPTASDAAVAVAAALGLLAVGALVGILVGGAGAAEHDGLRRSALGATAGWVASFTLTLLYPMHYEMPLPTGNRILAPLAMVVVTVLATRGVAAVPEAARSRVAVFPAVALAAAGALVATVLAVATPELEPAEAGAALTVASFNIDQAMTPDGAVDFVAAERIIEDLDADLVALQEVGRGWALSGMNDFVAWYRLRHPDELVWAWAADRQFGNLLISRVELREAYRLELPQGDGSMGRSAIVATVPTPDGDITVVAVHLQHRNSDGSIAAREAELQVVLDTWGGRPRTIVLGDFNANNQRPEGGGAKVLEGPDQANTLQPLLDAGFVTTQPTSVCTEPTSNDNCSDYIFVTPDLDLGSGVQVLEEQEIGDHRPIRAQIRTT